MRLSMLTHNNYLPMYGLILSPATKGQVSLILIWIVMDGFRFSLERWAGGFHLEVVGQNLALEPCPPLSAVGRGHIGRSKVKPSLKKSFTIQVIERQIMVFRMLCSPVCDASVILVFLKESWVTVSRKLVNISFLDPVWNLRKNLISWITTKYVYGVTCSFLDNA